MELSCAYTYVSGVSRSLRFTDFLPSSIQSLSIVDVISRFAQLQALAHGCGYHHPSPSSFQRSKSLKATDERHWIDMLEGIDSAWCGEERRQGGSDHVWFHVCFLSPSASVTRSSCLEVSSRNGNRHAVFLSRPIYCIESPNPPNLRHCN